MDSERSQSRGTITVRLDDLLAQIRSGNKQAIAEFFETARHQIRVVTQRILRGNSDVPDGRTDEIVGLSSEALFRQFQNNLATRCGTKRQLMGYLAQVIRRKAIDLARQSSGIKNQTQHPSRSLPPDLIGAVGQRLTFYEMIEDLPDQQKEVLDLHIVCSWSFDDIADLLRIGESTARREYNRALLRLKHEFND